MRCDDVISNRHHFRLVLHDETCVSDIAKLGQCLIKSLNVVRVQTNRRLVEDVERLWKARYARAERHLRHSMSDLFTGGIPRISLCSKVSTCQNC